MVLKGITVTNLDRLLLLNTITGRSFTISGTLKPAEKSHIRIWPFCGLWMIDIDASAPKLLKNNSKLFIPMLSTSY
jgi:hypothetical protein